MNSEIVCLEKKVIERPQDYSLFLSYLGLLERKGLLYHQGHLSATLAAAEQSLYRERPLMASRIQDAFEGIGERSNSAFRAYKELKSIGPCLIPRVFAWCVGKHNYPAISLDLAMDFLADFPEFSFPHGIYKVYSDRGRGHDFLLEFYQRCTETGGRFQYLAKHIVGRTYLKAS